MNTNLAIVLFAPVLVALNPALLATVFVMILIPDPKRLMLGYLAGAYAISIAVALVTPILLLVIYLCFMQQLLLELTLLADVFAPGRTQAVVVRIRTWLASHGRQIAAIGLAGVGILLSVSGLVTIS